MGKEVADSLPLSTYSAPGGLRQGPGVGAHLPAVPETGAADLNSLPTSVFDLPDRLAAKADPALITADERHFAAIAQSLEESVADLAGRIEAELRAPGGV